MTHVTSCLSRMDEYSDLARVLNNLEDTLNTETVDKQSSSKSSLILPQPFKK